MIRVFVAATTGPLRLGLRQLLEGPGLAVVGDAPTPEVAPAGVDVIVLGDGALVSDVAEAVTDGPGPAVVALADDDRAARVLRGLPLRGWALVSREAPGAELRAAVAAAAGGFVAIPAALAAGLLDRRVPGPVDRDGLTESLTGREREVLALLAQGLSNRRIAERLEISEHTVKFHVGSVYGKLGASSRADAVSRGIRQGFITL